MKGHPNGNDAGASERVGWTETMILDGLMPEGAAASVAIAAEQR